MKRLGIFLLTTVALSADQANPPLDRVSNDHPPEPSVPDKVVKVVNISGVYPHLAMTNTHHECGVGAVVPWAGKLWTMTYGPHLPNGGTDKLYEIHDGSHGWHTEWPRIRQLDPSDPDSLYLMHMHGLFFDFPKTFCAANFAGLKPISSYYKMPTDYCMFNELVCSTMPRLPPSS